MQTNFFLKNSDKNFLKNRNSKKYYKMLIINNLKYKFLFKYIPYYEF